MGSLTHRSQAQPVLCNNSAHEAPIIPPNSLTRLSHTPTTTTTTTTIITTIPATTTRTTAISCEDGDGDDDNEDDSDRDDLYLSGLRPMIAWYTSHGHRKSLSYSRHSFYVGCCCRSLPPHLQPLTLITSASTVRASAADPSESGVGV